MIESPRKKMPGWVLKPSPVLFRMTESTISTDPERLSERIDQITATLGGTSQWIRDQQQVYGEMEDLLTEPPRLGSSMRIREGQ